LLRQSWTLPGSFAHLTYTYTCTYNYKILDKFRKKQKKKKKQKQNKKGDYKKQKRVPLLQTS
jgi:hypothetical protein